MPGQKLTCFPGQEQVTLTERKQQIEGGEAQIWEVEYSEHKYNQRYIAKLYKKTPQREQVDKLKAMLGNVPENPTKKDNHISIAWPEKLLKEAGGDVVGFLMPYINSPTIDTLDILCSHRLRYEKARSFHWRDLHMTAQNLASIVTAIHRKGHLICDLKPQNILVDIKKGFISIIDTDSFQIYDEKSQKTYATSVLGTPDYMPPELWANRRIERNQHQDNFQLAIIIYQLLFGQHPFFGGLPNLADDEEPLPGMEGQIRQGFWLFGKTRALNPPYGTITIPLDIANPKIQDYFHRCFDSGHEKPDLRPTAEGWYHALQWGIDDLINQCSVNTYHYYDKKYGKCYWCEYAEIVGGDIFALGPKPSISSSDKLPKPNVAPAPVVSPTFKAPALGSNSTKRRYQSEPKHDTWYWELVSSLGGKALICLFCFLIITLLPLPALILVMLLPKSLEFWQLIPIGTIILGSTWFSLRDAESYADNFVGLFLVVGGIIGSLPIGLNIITESIFIQITIAFALLVSILVPIKLADLLKNLGTWLSFVVSAGIIFLGMWLGYILRN